MNTLIIPDVHGRKFWREPCNDIHRWDKVIFLGDYVDPYPGEATQEGVLTELKDIIDLKEKYKDKIILLWGNHDLFYWCEQYRRVLEYWSRHDYKRHNEIQSIFTQAKDLFQFAHSEGNLLFTHAGLNNNIARTIAKNHIDAKLINEYYNENPRELARVSMYRGGPDPYGSAVWCDIREIYGSTPCKLLENIFQIFGHTYSKTYIMAKYFAMLDMGGSWFYIDNGELKDNNEKLLKITQL